MLCKIVSTLGIVQALVIVGLLWKLSDKPLPAIDIHEATLPPPIIIRMPPKIIPVPIFELPDAIELCPAESPCFRDGVRQAICSENPV